MLRTIWSNVMTHKTKIARRRSQTKIKARSRMVNKLQNAFLVIRTHANVWLAKLFAELLLHLSHWFFLLTPNNNWVPNPVILSFLLFVLLQKCSLSNVCQISTKKPQFDSFAEKIWQNIRDGKISIPNSVYPFQIFETKRLPGQKIGNLSKANRNPRWIYPTYSFALEDFWPLQAPLLN